MCEDSEGRKRPSRKKKKTNLSNIASGSVSQPKSRKRVPQKQKKKRTPESKKKKQSNITILSTDSDSDDTGKISFLGTASPKGGIDQDAGEDDSSPQLNLNPVMPQSSQETPNGNASKSSPG